MASRAAAITRVACHRNAVTRALHCAAPGVMGGLPEEMRAAHIRLVGSSGGPEALETTTIPVPLPKPGEVLIKVEAAGVNRPDVLQRQGVYPPPPGHSQIPGLEVSGTIAAIGPDVAVEGCLFDPEIGARVCALTNGGGYAQFCVVPHTQVLPVPRFARDESFDHGSEPTKILANQLALPNYWKKTDLKFGFSAEGYFSVKKDCSR